uniref:Immunoglobulin domain-containing protein n=1 Tax=Cyprinus carpio TaxID=7962 RepID=A0A8C2HI02_CYPCA
FNFFFFNYFLYSGCFTTQTINQPKPVQQAKTGDSVTMQCFVLKKDFNLIVWYKQLLGKKPQSIAMFYYRNNVHFLKDVATYYCGVIKLTTLFFSSGTFLMITRKHSNKRRILEQPGLKRVHLSDNITLHSGEFWSRIIDGNKDAHFIMAVTQTCVYNFTMRILTLSDTGTYCCAMDVDGEIIIGHGTKLTITDTDKNIMNPVTLLLVSSNIISAVIIIIIIKQHKNKTLWR